MAKRKLKRPTESAMGQDNTHAPIGNKPTPHAPHASKKAWYKRQRVIDYNNPQTRAWLAQQIAKYNKGGGDNLASESQVDELREAWVKGKRIA